MFDEIAPRLAPLYKPFLENGYSIYVVGGAVRDLMMGGSPQDFDFTTDAQPQVVQKLFRRTVPTGIKHGTITVLIGNDSYEVTTFRTEGDYTDHRAPSSVSFTSNLAEDLSRRDFTINAFALTLPGCELIDYHEGQQDLKLQQIRAIGLPELRFKEDALRMLRACRFAARYGFTIEPQTWKALNTLHKDIQWLSKERIRDELVKTLMTGKPGYGLRLLSESGILPALGLSIPPGNLSLLTEVLDHKPSLEPATRLALVLTLTQGSRSESWLKDYTFSNTEIKKILQRLSFMQWLCAQPQQPSLAAIIYHWGSRNLEDMTDFLISLENLGIKPEFTPFRREFWDQLQQKSASNDPIFLGDLKIQGSVLMAEFQRKGGPWLGALLQQLLEEAWIDPLGNQTENLISRAKLIMEGDEQKS